MMIRKRCLVRGLVQGVGYRHFVSQRAGTMGLSGFARNTPTGGVEVEVQGEDTDVIQLIGLLHLGPADAIVQGVETEDMDIVPSDAGFNIK